MTDAASSQQILDALRRAALASYEPQRVGHPAMAAALENLAIALWRTQQERFDLSDDGPSQGA